jgi:hypothetical protein
MAFIADSIFDLALAYLDTTVNRLDICSQEPATYTAATSTYTLGNKATPTIGAPTDRSPNGRKVVVSAITDGSVTGTNTATHWALSYTTGSVLAATGQLSSSQAVTSGNTFTLGTFDIGIADAT